MGEEAPKVIPGREGVKTVTVATSKKISPVAYTSKAG
jgi:hypothetical protein